MAVAGQATSSATPSRRGWLGRFVPTWTASLVVHGLILAVFTFSLKSCRAPAGEGGETFRDVGLVVKNPRVPVASDSDSPPVAADPATTAAAASDVPDTTLDELLDLPAGNAPSLIGPGPAARADDGDPTQLIRPEGSGATTPLGRLEQGETRFLGIRDRGTRFVYVLDRSGSMADNHALQVAKAELISSLEHLDATQQFQVIFYNEEYRLLRFEPADQGPRLFQAKDVNKTQARREIGGVRAGGGTRHLPALLKALSFQPEVIFFLTDADEQSRLSPRDLETIRRRNRGRSRIHAIKFGQGAALSDNNYVRKLAEQNDGQYRYRDVLKFSRP